MSLKIDFEEAELHSQASPEFRITAKSMESTRKYIIAWEDIEDARKEIIGYSELGADNKIKRFMPMRDTNIPSISARSILIKPMDWASNDEDGTDGNKRNEYSKALLTVEYDRPPYYERDDALLPDALGAEFERFVEISGNLEGDYLSIGALQGTLKWASGQTGIGSQANLSFPEGVGKIIAYANLTMKWHQIPYDALPYAHIIAALGTINSVAFGSRLYPDDLTRQWARHTLLFLGATWERILFPDGNYGWDVTYLFKHNPKKWNFYFNPLADTPGFYQCTTNGVFFDPGTSDVLPDGLATYDETDFYRLFDLRDSV